MFDEDALRVFAGGIKGVKRGRSCNGILVLLDAISYTPGVFVELKV